MDVKIIYSQTVTVTGEQFTVDVSPSNIVDLFTAFNEILPAQ